MNNSSFIVATKTLLAHAAIFVIMLILISIFSYFNSLNNYTCIMLLISVLGMYLYSGYILTNSKTQGYKYFAVAIIGLLIWITAYITSPNSLNYKSDSEAGIWMIYRYYIAGIETPLNYISSFNIADNYSIRLEMYIIAFLPILASVMQYFGAKWKLTRLSKV